MKFACSECGMRSLLTVSCAAANACAITCPPKTRPTPSSLRLPRYQPSPMRVTVNRSCNCVTSSCALCLLSVMGGGVSSTARDLAIAAGTFLLTPGLAKRECGIPHPRLRLQQYLSGSQQFGLTRRHRFAKAFKVHSGIAAFRKQFVFLFFDMVRDIFAQNFDLGVE